MNERISCLVTRPAMPLPGIRLISTLCSAAILRTSGVERRRRRSSAGFTHPPSTRPAGGGGAGGGAGGGEGRLRGGGGAFGGLGPRRGTRFTPPRCSPSRHCRSCRGLRVDHRDD